MDMLVDNAFSGDLREGNPAGTFFDATGMGERAATAETGFSEPASLFPVSSWKFTTRYFGPSTEGASRGRAAIARTKRNGIGGLRRTGIGPVGVSADPGSGISVSGPAVRIS
ncbi:hypothetical protein ACTG9Q_15445 [Actinokineospora sp. 24-640]